MVKYDRKLIGGIFLAIIGAFLIAYSQGWISIPTGTSLSIAEKPGERIGISISTNFQRSIPLSMVAKGYTYQWRLDAKNTGTLKWDDSWVTLRIGVKGAQVIGKAIKGGVISVEKCDYGEDVVQCREDIRDEWMLKISYDGGATWQDPPCINPETGTYERVCHISFGPLGAGQTKSAWFRITVPANKKDGVYPLITNLMAQTGTEHGIMYAIASKVDPLFVGTIQGDIIMQLIGLLALVVGAALIAYSVM